ncbi:MAG: elongation factor P [Patescibacteria group bacterium]|nr:elongation factor P [Patescibacteria group bacterium]
MISFNKIKKGLTLIISNEPCEILEAKPLFKGRGHSILQAKIKNLVTKNIILKTFHPSETFEEVELNKIEANFLYSHRNRYYFSKKNEASQRFDLTKEQIGSSVKFLKPGQSIEGIIFNEKIINISVPVKVHLSVVEAPPGIRGNRSQSGTKVVTLETGAQISAPLFINIKDVVEINTETGEYSRRIK